MTEPLHVEPEDVMKHLLGHPMLDGALIHSAILVVEYSRPGQSERDEQGPWLHQIHDSVTPIWRHIGMLASTLDDYRSQLRRREDD